MVEHRRKEGKEMAQQRHYVFSARTTEEGLRLLNGVRKERNIGWDDLVIDAVCAHYGLDRLAMALPKLYRPEKKTEEKKKGGTKKHGKAQRATEQATDEATGI
jgi:hypothetical protein